MRYRMTWNLKWPYILCTRILRKWPNVKHFWTDWRGGNITEMRGSYNEADRQFTFPYFGRPVWRETKTTDNEVKKPYFSAVWGEPRHGGHIFSSDGLDGSAFCASLPHDWSSQRTDSSTDIAPALDVLRSDVPNILQAVHHSRDSLGISHSHDCSWGWTDIQRHVCEFWSVVKQ